MTETVSRFSIHPTLTMSFTTLISGRTAAIAVAAGLVFTASACDSNKPEDPGAGQEELITQVVVRLQNDANASDIQTITATDADGDGTGLVFSPAGLRLTPGATYTSTITLNDQINNRNVTDEIKEEAEDHRFQYTVTPTSAATVTVTDRESNYVTTDNNGAGDLPVGLAFRVAVASGATGAGTFNATLFHFDDGAIKNSATATSDERDIDINFPVSFSATARPALASLGN